MPALEALACGAPLVTTKGSVMEDVVGDAALLVAPGDVEALAGALDMLVRGDAGLADRRARGRTIAARHTWERARRRTSPSTGRSSRPAGSVGAQCSVLTSRGASGFVGQWLHRAPPCQGDEVSAPEVEITDAAAAHRRRWPTPAGRGLPPRGHRQRRRIVGRPPADVRRQRHRHAQPARGGAPADRRADGAARVLGRGVRPGDARRAAAHRGRAAAAGQPVRGQQGRGRVPRGCRPTWPTASRSSGPGRSTTSAPARRPTFVVSSLARQIAEAVGDGGTGRSRSATSAPRRDFTDVRDVVRAYRLLVERGTPGEVYNVCSGEDVAVSDMAARLIALAAVDVELRVVDPSGSVTSTCRCSGAIRAAWSRPPDGAGSGALDETLADVLASGKALAGSEFR